MFRFSFAKSVKLSLFLILVIKQKTTLFFIKKSLFLVGKFTAIEGSDVIVLANVEMEAFDKDFPQRSDIFHYSSSFATVEFPNSKNDLLTNDFTYV